MSSASKPAPAATVQRRSRWDATRPEARSPVAVGDAPKVLRGSSQRFAPPRTWTQVVGWRTGHRTGSMGMKDGCSRLARRRCARARTRRRAERRDHPKSCDLPSKAKPNKGYAVRTEESARWFRGSSESGRHGPLESANEKGSYSTGCGSWSSPARASARISERGASRMACRALHRPRSLPSLPLRGAADSV